MYGSVSAIRFARLTSHGWLNFEAFNVSTQLAYLKIWQIDIRKDENPNDYVTEISSIFRKYKAEDIFVLFVIFLAES